MTTSPAGIALICHFEGCKLEAYLCPAGVLTIGWGHTEGVAPGMRIDQAQADELLARDLASVESSIGGASNEFGRWIHAGSEVLPGLVARRAAEQAMFNVTDAPGVVPQVDTPREKV